MSLNEVLNFPSFIYKYFAYNFSQCLNPIHLEHALHVHAESFFDKKINLQLAVEF